MADVEMKDAPNDKTKDVQAPKDPALVIEDIKQNINLLEKASSTKETRFILRVLRQTPSIRRRLKGEYLAQVITNRFPSTANTDEAKSRSALLSYLPAPVSNISATSMDIDAGIPKEIIENINPKSIVAEVEVYLHILVLVYLLDQDKREHAIACADSLITRITALNKRSLQLLTARAYFYYARCYELAHRSAEIRAKLLAAHRTAILQHDDESQATILNLLLRNYLEYNLYDQADKLVSKTTFPEAASNNQWARYFYYQGRIKAIQLEYTEAYLHLIQALRKAPHNGVKGFRRTVYKLVVIVQLLMGEIPERNIYYQPDLRQALKPYLQLTQTVRIGNLVEFNKVVAQHSKVFTADKTYTLILRLRHNVIKTGLRKINLSYSRISLVDISAKLQLENAEDVEFIVAKAIKDGVIDAIINHEKGFIQSRENQDIYSTHEPQQAFHKRITFCLQTHNEAVKAMTFPESSQKDLVESNEERRKRLQEEQELAQNLADEDEDEIF